MKILLLLPLIAVFAQAADTSREQLALVLKQCAEEKHQDLNKIIEISKSSNIPIDNAGYASFFECYWKKLLLIKDNGDIDYSQVKVVITPMVKEKFSHVPDAAKLMDDAINHCKTAIQGYKGTNGAKCITFRNCLFKFSEKYV